MARFFVFLLIVSCFTNDLSDERFPMLVHAGPCSAQEVPDRFRFLAQPSGDLTDRVMAAVEDRDLQSAPYVQLADRLNESRSAQWAACLAALVVGSLPFLLVAHAAELLVF